MLEVTEAQKTAFKGTSVNKELVITFPDISLTVTNAIYVEAESMTLTERLLSDTNIEFVGCNASEFEVTLRNIQQDLKGQHIVVTLNANNTGAIPLFRGIVDSVKMESNKTVKTIHCYDELYTKGQMDIASWYNGLTFPITIKNFRDSLFTHIGLTQETVELPNDDIAISKKYNPKTLQCLNVLKYLCQINGCFGIINRSGIFEYRFIDNAFEPVYPATNLYPENELYPVDDTNESQGIADNIDYYKSIDYEEFLVNPVQRLQIRENENDLGVTVGNPSGNKYIIQGNMFAFDQDTATLTTMAENIWLKIANISFHPCSTDNTGLPYIEVGDVVSYTLVNSGTGDSSYDANKFNVMSRTMKGIQSLRDNYEAEGEQDQSEFITDIQAQLDAIKQSSVDMSSYYTGSQIDEMLTDYYTTEQADYAMESLVGTAVSQMETPTGFNVVSCYTLPSARQSNTIYLVQGGVIIR